MENKAHRDLENERQELIGIMLKNIPDEIISLIKTIQDKYEKDTACPAFSVSAEGTNYAK